VIRYYLYLTIIVKSFTRIIEWATWVGVLKLKSNDKSSLHSQSQTAFVQCHYQMDIECQLINQYCQFKIIWTLYHYFDFKLKIEMS